MKAVVAAFNQEKALVGAFSVIMNLRMELFEALVRLPTILHPPSSPLVMTIFMIFTLLQNIQAAPQIFTRITAVLTSASQPEPLI